MLGATNVQAAIGFEAPPEVSCRLEVSENPNYDPLINDVNPSLFTGADLDNRTGNVVDSGKRIFVAGSRSVNQALDQKWYSRALQTDTLHYFRIKCGNDTATGSFRTANIPVGTTYPWPFPQDPANGNFRWPSTDNANRNQTIIDPNYGTLIRRISVPGDAPDDAFLAKPFANAGGASWTNPQGGLKDDAQSASYGGTGKDWLTLTDPGIGLTPFYEEVQSVSAVKLNVKGSGGAVEVCLTIDGVSCRGEIRTVVLDTPDSTKTVGAATAVDTWGDALWTYDVSSRLNKQFGVMIRPAKAGTPVSIQFATIDVTLSDQAAMPEAGFYKTCSPQKSNGGYHCSYPGPGHKPNNIFWIQPDTGEVRFLGSVVAGGWGGATALCFSNEALWDPTDPNIYYCVGTTADGKQALLKGTYSGNDNAPAPGSAVNMSWVNLTPAPYTLETLLKNFSPEFDPTKFGCNIIQLTTHHAVLKCLLAGQDSAGLIAAFDLGNRQPLGSGGTGSIVAAQKTYASPQSRWCGLHSLEPITGIDWIGWNAQFLRDSNGNLMYNTTLASSIPAANGRYTIQVSGEPAPVLTDALAGDVFSIPGAPSNDTLRIVQKNSSTEWVVDRTATRGQPVALEPGAKLAAFCVAYVGVNAAPTLYWDFVHDPNGVDATGKLIARETILAGSHIVQRGDYRLQEWWQDGFQIVTPGAPKSWNSPITYTIESNPKYDGKRVWLGLSEPYVGMEGYQTHPSYENYLAQSPGRGNWFTDIFPFIGSAKIHAGVLAVAGASQVYKVPNKTLHPGTFPPFARCGGRQLKNISPGPIADRDVYSFCTGAGCSTGATDTDVFVNCPAPVTAKSICTDNYFGDESSVCVSEMTAYGQAVSQFYFDPSGKRSRVLTNAMMPWHAPRTFMLLDTTSPLPDGSWIVFPSFGNNARRDLYMVKVPAQPAFDSNAAAGSSPVTVTVAVAPPADARFVNASLQFGASPKLESSTAAQACSNAAPCSVTFSARPMELVFVKPVYLDAGNKKAGEGAVTVQAALPSPAVKQKPQITAQGIVNSASFQLPIAPGAFVSLFGRSLSGCTGETAKALPLTDNLCGTQVLFNGKAGPMYYASDSQVIALAPYALVTGQALKVAVNNGGTQSDEVTIAAASVLDSAPAIFVANNLAVITSADGALISPARPLRLGEVGVIYANSLGATNPAAVDGQASASDPLARTVRPVEVVVNGTTQQVSFAGLTPGSVGLYQVNFLLGAGTAVKADGTDEVKLRVSGVDSPVLRTVLSAN